MHHVLHHLRVLKTNVSYNLIDGIPASFFLRLTDGAKHDAYFIQNM